jgi:hypothetical protein
MDNIIFGGAVNREGNSISFKSGVGRNDCATEM